MAVSTTETLRTASEVSAWDFCFRATRERGQQEEVTILPNARCRCPCPRIEAWGGCLSKDPH